MMRDRNDISAGRVREALDYDPETGNFTWREPLSSRAKVGQRAGRKDGRGYIRIGLDGFYYNGHRLAWLYVYGEWPDGGLDHRNRDKTDNRIENLRLATKSQNMANSYRRKDNASGFKGIYFQKDKRKRPWLAQIRKDGKKFHLGYFPTPEEGHAAYAAAARRLFGEFARAS